MGATWYLNPRYICCNSDINGICLISLATANVEVKWDSDFDYSTSCSIPVPHDNVWSVVCDPVCCLYHQISLVGVLMMTGSGRSSLLVFFDDFVQCYFCNRVVPGSCV